MSLDVHALHLPKWLTPWRKPEPPPMVPPPIRLRRRTPQVAVPTALPLSVGEVLKSWRLARGLSLVDVEQTASQYGLRLGHTTASRIERDQPGTSPERYRAYLRVLTEWEQRP